MTKLGPDGKPVATLRIQPYEWFATEPAGLIGAEMMPVILLRILPDLAVEYGEKDPEDRLQPLFGEPSDAFAKFGFWRDPRPEAKDRPLPLGFAWTAGHKDDPIPLSLSIRTCAGCHTGRVRLDDGSIRVLVGSPNTEILLHQYDIAVATFFAKHLADDKIKDFEQAILKLVDAKHTADPNYFFKDSEGYDAAEEGRQVGVFRAALGLPPERRGILASIKRAAGLKLLGVANLERVAYSKRNSPRLAAGPPGLIDSSGLGIAAFLAPAKLDAKDVLFAGATKNDVPAVWNQWTRKQWQWDGNIRDVLARNLVAALGLVGLPEEMDITANALASEFIDGLPPAPYPFAITRDDDQLRRGRALFEANCIACHQDDQHRGDGRPLPIFNDLGTDMNRAGSSGRPATRSSRKPWSPAISPPTFASSSTIRNSPPTATSTVTPCSSSGSRRRRGVTWRRPSMASGPAALPAQWLGADPKANTVYRPGATTSRSVERRDGGKCHHIPISHQMDILDLHSMLNRVCLYGHSENFLFLI